MAKKKNKEVPDDDEATGEESEESEGGKKGKKAKGGKSMVLPAVILAVGMLGAGFMLKGGGGGSEAKEEEPAHETTTTLAPDTPRSHLTFEPMTVNVSGGKYLRVGLALSLMQGAAYGEGHGAEHPAPTIPVPAAGGHGGGGEDHMAPIVKELTPEVSDMVLRTLGGSPSDFLTTPEGREEARSKLSAQLSEHMHADVKVYFTSFVVA